MQCRCCASPLARPGDYCLVCQTTNTDTVIIECDRERATVTCLYDGDIVAERTITTVPESNERWVPTERRNYAGRIIDEVRRKRPDAVYAAGDHSILQAIRADLHYSISRVVSDDPVDAVRNDDDDSPLAVVEATLAEKLGGSHSTLIGGRDGRQALKTVAAHPNVKKIIPGPIDASGTGSQSGVRAKATRPDQHGNVRLLLRDGSSVQENRVVTTAHDRDGGNQVAADLNDALADAEFTER